MKLIFAVFYFLLLNVIVSEALFLKLKLLGAKMKLKKLAMMKPKLKMMLKPKLKHKMAMIPSAAVGFGSAGSFGSQLSNALEYGSDADHYIDRTIRMVGGESIPMVSTAPVIRSYIQPSQITGMQIPISYRNEMIEEQEKEVPMQTYSEPVHTYPVSVPQPIREYHYAEPEPVQTYQVAPRRSYASYPVASQSYQTVNSYPSYESMPVSRSSYQDALAFSMVKKLAAFKLGKLAKKLLL
jgi:hypothetical protein